MKIAIISFIYNNKLTYFENICATTLHEMGHEVCVFSSNHAHINHAELTKLDETSPWKVVRAHPVLKLRGTQIPFDNSIGGKIQEFNPQVVFLTAPLGGLGYFWLKYLPRDCKVVSVFSDIPAHRNKWFNFWFIKRRWFKKIAVRSDLILAATPQTCALLNEWGCLSYESKMRLAGLPFHFRSLDSDGTLMPELSQFISNNKKIAAIVTRVISGKLLDILLARVIVFLEENENYGVIFAGLTDNQASLQLHLISEMSNVGSRILLLEQIPSHTVGDIFRNSNFSIWTGVSIGMYHSLSCGCPVVLMRNRGSAEHLIHEGINGMWYDDLDGIPVALTSADSKEWNRKKIANSVRHANSNEYFSNILKELKCEV